MLTLCSTRKCLATIWHPDCDYVPNGLLHRVRCSCLTRGRCTKPWGTPQVVRLLWHVLLTPPPWCLPRLGWLLTGAGCFLGLHHGGQNLGLPLALWTRRPGIASQWDWTWQPWAANVCCVVTLGSCGPTATSIFWLPLVEVINRPRMWRGQISRRSHTTMWMCIPLAPMCTGMIHHGSAPPAPFNYLCTTHGAMPGSWYNSTGWTSHWLQSCVPCSQGGPWLLPLISPPPPWPSLAQPHRHCGLRWGQVAATTGGKFGERRPTENAQLCGDTMRMDIVLAGGGNMSMEEGLLPFLGAAC